jgi:signal peptidase I
MRSTWAATYAPPGVADTRPSRRLPVAAAVLSAIAPGFGQALAMRFTRGVVVALLNSVVGSTLAAALLAYTPGRVLPLVAPLTLDLAIRGWVARDAWRVAHLPRPAVSAWRRVGSLLALAVCIGAFEGLVADKLRRRYVAEAFKIPAGSMSPTIETGDYLIVAPLRRPPARGQIIAFQWPPDTTKHFLKRVAGVPGDTLAMRDGVLVLNGRTVDEPYAHRTDPDADPSATDFEWQRSYLVSTAEAARVHPSRNNWGPLVVSPDSYFVLGDNRDNSLDGRFWGFVPGRHVRGAPRRIYFSRDPETGRIRWERIGRAVAD